jgi:hypothetical protein
MLLGSRETKKERTSSARIEKKSGNNGSDFFSAISECHRWPENGLSYAKVMLAIDRLRVRKNREDIKVLKGNRDKS